MLLELDNKEFDEDESFESGEEETEKDFYEFEDIDQKIFQDPELMVKWLEKGSVK